MTLLSLQRDFRIWLTTEPSELPAAFDERSRAGLAVYLNNYRAQLVACLTTSYPVVRLWIGESAFESAAAHHIDRVPPHAWTLDAYGSNFSETLATLYPGDAEVAELARLEAALAAAFVGIDAEPLDPGTLANIDWDAACIHLVPTFTLLPVGTNAGLIWSAITRGEAPPAACSLPAPAFLVIWRDSLAPEFRTATTQEASVLTQLQDGNTFGDVCTGLVAQMGEEQGTALAGALLRQWLSDHLIARVAER